MQPVYMVLHFLLAMVWIGSAVMLDLRFRKNFAGASVEERLTLMRGIRSFSSKTEMPITLLLFFVIPCTLKPKWILRGLLGIETYGFLFSELKGAGGIAHSAHLGGMLAGLFFFGYMRQGSFGPVRRPRLQKPSWLRTNKPSRKASAPTGYSVNLGDREFVQQEVDRILDKINERGFGSLTEKEKRILDQAKSHLGK